jgi:mono/diheme cytochrome c family protein
MAVILGIAAAYVSMRSLPKHTPEKINLTVEYTPERVENGTKLASMVCRSCHLNDETGIRRDGVYIPPYMPKLAHISDEDMFSIVAFLRSENRWVQPDPTEQQESKTSFLTNFLVTIGAVKPFPYPKAPIAGPDTTNPVKHGEYIALYQLECFSCHSKDFAKNDYFTPSKSPGFFGGGNKMYRLNGEEIHSLNITTDPNTGIGSWSEGDFVQAVKFGKVPLGKPALRDPMLPYSNLTDKEAKAIFAYLKTVPKLNNKVERKFQEQ